MLLTLSWLSISPCCKPPDPELIPIGETRIIGDVKDGVITWAEGENPNGEYLIVTKQFHLKLLAALYKIKVLEKKIEILEAQMRKK